MPEAVRVRLAPSPTGQFHIGTARTALFNYLFAKKHGGEFILRIEDTDKERSDDVFTKDILEGLLWLGLGWDEGPEVGGSYGPYFQQERLESYRRFAQELLEQGKAYRCYCSAEELERDRQNQLDHAQAPKYSGRCRHLSLEEKDEFERSGRESVIRFAVENQVVSFNDLIRGQVEFDAGGFGDFVIMRSDDTPLFAFSGIIDDALMKITHVLRGEEHLANTAKQILLAEALQVLPPQYGHLPLILNPDKSKMSKRSGPVSITDDFRHRGYLPQALVNFMVLLGWASGTDREIYSLEELVEEFTLERVGKSPSVFDQEKLDWMNGYYIRNLPLGDVASYAQDFIKNKQLAKAVLKDQAYYLKVIACVRERLKRLDEIEENINFFYFEPSYKPSLLIAKKSTPARTKKALKLALASLKKLSQFSLDETETVLRQAARESDLKDGELLWAVRASISGQQASPGAFELLEVLGKTKSLARLEKAIENLG